jgi:hypothetical protein
MWRGVIDDAAIQSARREFLRWDIDFDALTRLD